MSDLEKKAKEYIIELQEKGFSCGSCLVEEATCLNWE